MIAFGGAGMKRRAFTLFLGGIFAGFRPRRLTMITAMVALALLPVEISLAGWLSPTSKKSSSKWPRLHAMPKSQTTRLAALGLNAVSRSASKSLARACDPSKFRIVLDVGHTAESEGAISARNVAEFVFNLRLAQEIDGKLKAEGFSKTRLLVTEGPARRSLVKRVAVANNLHADLFLSIHHDSVPDSFLENWEFEGKKGHFSDRFSGYSLFVSHDNPAFKTSLLFANLVGKEMKAQGLQYAQQYGHAIMGRYQHPLLNKETGVYSYDRLVVLKSTRMPAVLLEAGSIINRDEELKMDSLERRDIISRGVTAAVKEFCGPPSARLMP
jgi:N-acetylmuramoyl-L-alanine amidase